MHTWIDIATLTKKRNAQGRFVARCQANLLLCLKPGLEVAFVPPALDAPRRARIVDVTKTNETTADISFEYTDGLWNTAEEDELVGRHFLVKRDELDEGTFVPETSALLGFQVVDAATGLVGVVQDEMQNPGQDLLVVTKASDGSELLVPFVSEIVTDIDYDDQRVYVDLPVGLLEL